MRFIKSTLVSKTLSILYRPSVFVINCKEMIIIVPHSNDYITKSPLVRLAGISLDRNSRATHDDNPFEEFSTLGTAPPPIHGRGTPKYVMIIDSQGRMNKMTENLRSPTSTSTTKIN